MRSTHLGLVLCAIMLLAFFPPTVEAQDVPAGWEIGLVYDQGASDDDPFTLDEDETTIRFWIRNDNLAGDIEIALEYDSSSSATLSGEESVTVGSGTNDTFSLKMSGIDVWNIAAGTTYEFEIDGELTSWGVAPLPLPVSSESTDGEVIVPKLHRWKVDIEEIGHPVNAGTEFNLKANLKNIGNTADSFTSASIEDDCPVLTVDDEPLQAMEGAVTQPGIANTVTLVFDASSTHPTRICEIEIEVKSTGVVNGGIGDTSNKDETNIDVEARPVGAQQDQNDASVGDDDGPENQEQVTSDNFLLFPTLVTPMAILWAALVRAREE
ncbi:MAG: hypothetical protein OSB33_00320 [Candidatus Poseidoniales archaeon]|nr:hypothetical protein [Candidatus Poseidoniales archaeon]